MNALESALFPYRYNALKELGAPSPANALNTRLLDEGTISQGNALDFSPAFKNVVDSIMEMTGISPSERLVERLKAVRSPVLRPKTPFGWADWAAGTASEGLQTGLAAADLAGIARTVGPKAGQRLLNVLADQRGQVENIFKNLTPEEKFNRLSPRQQKEIELKIAHEDEMFLDKHPTYGWSDKKVKDMSAKIRREAIEKYNRYENEFKKTGLIDTGYHSLFGGEVTREESLKLLDEAKKEMIDAIKYSDNFLKDHELTKSKFFKNNEWISDGEDLLGGN